jgi:hypothetical protein
MWHSHSGEAVWKQLIRDTVEGKSLDKMASELDLTHATAFNMRHKVLLALEGLCEQESVILGGVCELDETCVLESYKGTFLKERYDGYRGVATKYLNCYNTLLSRIFRSGTDLADEIYNTLCSNKTNSFYSIEKVKSHHLLTL